ncbi:unnamed protein product [Brassicogethes aeneus]|uniref:Vacuolar protein sorting-associated protein VTA1 homolog n=1 Tax=Brassicogethes aeneus TaxID=1431903 RepID=A0A9P0B8L2_BRAAE|nr:unnamed protein product [Brassicogethes aeneus]
MGFPPVPVEIKPVAHLLKLADEHESRNIVVAYWARMAACRLALKILPPGKKPPQVSELLTALLDWLEQTKRANSENEGITQEPAAAAIIEEYALQLFDHGDQQDRAEIYNKNTVKTFYTCGMLMDCLEQFGLSEDITEKRRYAKWKAAYIHNCLKTGDRPIPGNPGEHEDNIMHISELTDEEKAKFKEDLEKERTKDGANDNLGLLGIPNFGSTTSETPDDNIVPNPAPAPASTPTTPSIQPQPTPFVPPQPVITPFQPATPVTPTTPSATGYAPDPAQIQKAQKFCKYATSALNYDDVKTAVENLQKALNMLQFGKEA